jgi:hypothetical protein
MIEVQLPPVISDAKVRAAAEVHSRLVAEEAAARLVVADLEGRRPAAEAADRQAHADAIRHAEPEPAPVEVARLDEELAAGRRRAEAVGLAAADAWTELVAVVEAQRARWSSEIDKAVERDRKRLVEAVEALEAAAASLSVSMATLAWARRFPHKPRMLPSAATSAVAGLVSRSGEPYAWPEVLAALRRFGQQPTEPAQPPVPIVTPAGSRRFVVTATGQPPQ